jgi:hypothetical protein
MGLIERIKNAASSRGELQRRVEVFEDKARRSAARVAAAQEERDRLAALVVDGADSDLAKLHDASEALAAAERGQADIGRLLEAARKRLENFDVKEVAAQARAHNAAVRSAAGDIVAAIADFEAGVSRLQALIRRVETDLEAFRKLGGARVASYPHRGGMTNLRERMLHYLNCQLAQVWIHPDNQMEDIAFKAPSGLSARERRVLAELLDASAPRPNASDDPPRAA